MPDDHSPFSARELLALRTEDIADQPQGPERVLMCAVLDDAVKCAVNRKPKNSSIRILSSKTDAQAWLFSDACDWPFSFMNICRVLGYDPDYVRLGVQRMIERQQTMRHQPRRQARMQGLGRRAT